MTNDIESARAMTAFLPSSKIFRCYATASAYVAYAEAAGFIPELLKWNRSKWRVTISV